MLISDDSNYSEVLKRITISLKINQVSNLLLGRTGIIKLWIDTIQLIKLVGPKSIIILTNDINSIIDKIYGESFK